MECGEVAVHPAACLGSGVRPWAMCVCCRQTNKHTTDGSVPVVIEGIRPYALYHAGHTRANARGILGR